MALYLNGLRISQDLESQSISYGSGLLSRFPG
jgi:hypothetical protein